MSLASRSRVVPRPGEFNVDRIRQLTTGQSVVTNNPLVATAGAILTTLANAPPAAPLVPLAGGIVTRTEAPTAPTPSTTTPPAGGMTPGWETQLSPVGVLPTFNTPVEPPPAAPILQPAPTGAIITTSATPPAAATPSPVPMSLQFGSGPSMRSQFSAVPGVGGGINPNIAVVGRAVGTVATNAGAIGDIVSQVGRGIQTVRGWFGGGSSAPSIPAPSGAMPGVGSMGLVPSAGAVATVAGRVGGAIGRIAGSKKVRGVVSGVVGWWLVDKVTGALLGPADPPRRRMNHLNPKALARANRRVCGFRDIAAKSLRQYGYTVSSTRSPRSCKSKKRKCR